MLAQTFLSQVWFYVGDPELVGQLMTTKNLKFDRCPIFESLMSPLFGKSFLFSQSNAHWKKLRKACSNAFYKDRIDIMIGSIKSKLAMTHSQWIREIESSKDGSCDVDLRSAPKDIFERIMSEVVMGYDFCDDKIVFKDYAFEKDGIHVVDREMTMIESGGRIMEQILAGEIARGSTSFGSFTQYSGLARVLKYDYNRARDHNVKTLKQFC